MMRTYIQKNGFKDTEKIIRIANALATKYGEAAASVTCDMYEAVAKAQGVTVPAAEPARTPTMEETENVIRSALKRAPSTVPDETGKLVKKTSTRTMRKNAARDNAKMALVPGGDGCAFCMMLASRGWEPARSNKSFDAHLHKNCKCEYVVRFKDDLTVEGYDPDAIKADFMSLEGDNWDERINAMRRKIYAEKKKKRLLLEAESPFKNPKTPLTISSFDQSKHIVGGQKYNEYMKTHKFQPSYLTISEEEAQKLVDKYHGTGILKLDKNGNLLSSEMIVDNDKIIGFAVNNRNGQKVKTTGFKIHYSDNGTHIVPMYQNQTEHWKERREQNGHDWLFRQKS